MTMIIGGAHIALVDSRHGSMQCEAYPSRLAMVLAVLNNGALGDGGHGSEAHKAALATVAQHIVDLLARIEQRQRRDAEIDAARDAWTAQAAARYVEEGQLCEEAAASAAASLFALYANGEGDLPDPAVAAHEDIDTWD